MKVKCVNNKYAEGWLTKNKVYAVIEETERCYTIVDDNFVTFSYPKSRFVPVVEEQK